MHSAWGFKTLLESISRVSGRSGDWDCQERVVWKRGSSSSRVSGNGLATSAADGSLEILVALLR